VEGDAEPVIRAQLEGLENQEVERALERVCHRELG